MTLWLLLIVLSVGSARLTRLTVKDDFPPVQWTRDKIVGLRPDRPNGNHWAIGELVSCHWCSSGWISLGLVGGTWLIRGLPLPVLIWLAVWGAAAVLVDRLG
jgi:hypothetical protein